eukprot:TRINITY_DN8144_c0_g1_i1.p1 TRINITY_DN8144_c0_g1~~TRINITY_DN8144_c0_g1_i1.p1  ORF type:complete len:1104 (-),score=220.70 TRINITY_DN8144_c0_g1_i1:358-3669(-)
MEATASLMLATGQHIPFNCMLLSATSSASSKAVKATYISCPTIPAVKTAFLGRQPKDFSMVGLRSSIGGQPAHGTGIIAETAKAAGAAVLEAGATQTLEALVHYYRRDGDYEGWGLHLWGDTPAGTAWDAPLKPAGEDKYGVFWKVPVAPGDGSQNVSFLVHRGDQKDCTGELPLSGGASATGVVGEVWLVADRSKLFSEEPDTSSLPQGNLDLAKAFWLTADTLAWNLDGDSVAYTLHASRDAALELTGKGVQGADISIPLELDPKGLPSLVKEKFPYIAHYSALKISDSASPVDVAALLRGQLAISAADGAGVPLDATGVQIAGALDDLYAYEGPLGLDVDSGDKATLRVWAPTAQSVHLLVFNNPTGDEESERVAMHEEKGVWSVSGSAAGWKGRYYLYEVKAFHPTTGKVETGLGVDPYSRGLSANGERSLFVNLNDSELKPHSWDTLSSQKPHLEVFNDISILELHIRDFSISDKTLDPAVRGGYLAFSEQESAGVRHLKGLKEAGLTHIHLLPCFDFSSVNERKETWKTVDEALLGTYPPDSEEQQAAVVSIQNEDGFNWGYDPVNYGVPEGSYASDPDGAMRTKEFRSMVQAINGLGLRVVLDVVYNHTHGSGHYDRQSVLDKIVPGYYLRRNVEGYVENSTCMNNTASEHFMMDRLIVDDLLMWATQYKVDGFRFDLMGHLMKSTMMKAKDALQSLTLEKDGVDGSKIYIYGEGWNFGEVSGNQRGLNACQLNLAGSGIGSFNDRIRDTAMGGSPFGDPLQQGFLTGLLLQPNELDQGSPEQQAETLAATTDWIKVGLTGNLKDYSFTSYKGQKVKGSEVLTHDGVSVGYTASPEEVVNYVSAHDNETLFDVIMLKTASSVSLEQKCRINHMATSLIALQQGIAFFHAGDDMLRSKSLDRDSYNSGDWFNKLDFTYTSNNFGVGLPPKGKNGEKWPIMKRLLADPSLQVGPREIGAAVANLRELLQIRYSSPLFRLKSTEEVQARLEFLGAADGSQPLPPGVIAMSLKGGECPGAAGQRLPPLDSNYSRIVVVFNARPEECSLDLQASLGDHSLTLHPVQASGSDAVVKTASFEGGVAVVPARTTAVFVESAPSS